MTKRLVIVGAGHAGSAAALAAARQRFILEKEADLTITVINASPYLGIRPRYYEYELEQTQVELHSFLDLIKVEVLIARVTKINLQDHSLIYSQDGQEDKLTYDRIILALGSELVHANIPGIESTFNIDSYLASMRFKDEFESRVLALCDDGVLRVAILGGGITGLELACELPVTASKICKNHYKNSVAIEVFIIDRHCTTNNLGGDTQAYVQEALSLAHVACIDNAVISAVKKGGVIYNETHRLDADMIVSTLGLRANPLVKNLFLDYDDLGRVSVNEFLQVKEMKQHVYAVGDCAVSDVDCTHKSVMSCQQGRPQGRYAGYNAVASLYGGTLLSYSQPNYVTCVDLGDYGALYTEGWQRKVKAFGQEAKKMKQHINIDRIYPPQNQSKASVLEAGRPEFLTPVQTLTS